ncbi:pilus assembly protein [Microcella daejeonensis]|uniref:TadE/TadG family type IV pilus assembly protein n=1 Tax=Microcella daejeonensis TaxID=2994971 RepID=UPI002271AC99|nr:TadE/TadG family type IV pilus assembly protein [Microcella daejeonensis]WAB82986.1 pilus assembly protein [Microcella daejeonensis]
MRRWSLADDRGSAPVEFTLVGVLLTVVTLSVLQVALALHVRSTLIDAAAEGARYAALADSSLERGVERSRELIETALGPGYARDISVAVDDSSEIAIVTVSVRSPLPLVGLAGLDGTLEVSGRAALEPLR